MRTPARRLGWMLALGLIVAGCDPRTTEVLGPDPRIEAEVARTAEALAEGPLKAPGKGVVIALVESGELHWVRAFGAGADGQEPAEGAVREVPELLPTLLAIGLERLVDAGRLTLTEERRRELQAGGAASLAAELAKAAGGDWRQYLRKEILEPLGMKNTGLPEGAEPSLSATAEDLVRLVVDLQKSNAGRTWRRLRQEGAQRLLQPLAEGRGFGLELGGQGQSVYFVRRGQAGGEAFVFLGFTTSGNGAVIFGSDAETVAGALRVLALTYDWPGLKE